MYRLDPQEFYKNLTTFNTEIKLPNESWSWLPGHKKGHHNLSQKIVLNTVDEESEESIHLIILDTD